MARLPWAKDDTFSRNVARNLGWPKTSRANVNVKFCFIMKKLSFKRLDLGTRDLLQREQLKSVFGGGGYSCDSQCSVNNEPCIGANGFGTCQLDWCPILGMYALVCV